MNCWHPLRLLMTAIVFVLGSSLSADDAQATRRRHQSQEFHIRAQERAGLLVPMYLYLADIHKNASYNRLIDCWTPSS